MDATAGHWIGSKRSTGLVKWTGDASRRWVEALMGMDGANHAVAAINEQGTSASGVEDKHACSCFPSWPCLLPPFQGRRLCLCGSDN
jgi:hypothetical protein